MIEFNLNETIYVKLTPYGFKTLENNHFNFWRKRIVKPIYSPPTIDEQGFTQFQLWVFISEFGRDMSLNSETVVEHNRVYFKKEPS